jgi:hypothetical protein
MLHNPQVCCSWPKNGTFLIIASQGLQILNGEELNQVVANLVDSTRQLGLNTEAEALG